jgi:glucose/arabinose dehydrogenase
MVIRTLANFTSRTGFAITTVAVWGLLAACATNPTPTVSANAKTSETPDKTASAAPPVPGELLTGKEALGDWTTDAPGVRRKLTVNDLPPPFDTPSANNGPGWADREGSMPKAPPGFSVNIYKEGLANPRVIVTAPNGDIFVAESEPRRGAPGNIKVLRDTKGDGKADVVEDFATGLKQPFGIGFYPVGPNPRWVYVAQTDSVIRFPYKNGDLKASGSPEMIVDSIPGGGRLRGGGHWTRDLQFSADGKKMFVSVGSLTNVDQEQDEQDNHRARILVFDPDGKNGGVYATGIRNPVGLAIQPSTGQLWTSVNERDGLGDDLVPDYVTSVKEGGFYGWPWYYIGDHQDPRHQGEHPELIGKIIVPDVLLESHYASLDLIFYTGKSFPKEYQGSIFACEHGSWNRSKRVGYKVIRIPIGADGKATGEFEDFLTGFVRDSGHVWGRPVGVTVAQDGALLVTDDSSGTVWRVAYTGK